MFKDKKREERKERDERETKIESFVSEDRMLNVHQVDKMLWVFKT